MKISEIVSLLKDIKCILMDIRFQNVSYKEKINKDIEGNREYLKRKTKLDYEFFNELEDKDL